MQHFLRTLTIILTVEVALVRCHNKVTRNLFYIGGKPEISNIFEKFLKDIQMERQYDTILVLQQQNLQDLRLEAIFRCEIPLVILSASNGFSYKSQFNSEMLTVVLMSQIMNRNMMATLAQTLDNMRQVRILVVAEDVANREKFRRELLELCVIHNMTNVLLYFYISGKDMNLVFDRLHPYPEYHWNLNASPLKTEQYFPKHWRNLENKTLITFPDKVIGRNLIYEDSQGRQQLSGYVASLVLLFAERFNASLKMYQPLVKENYMHFTVIVQMVIDGKLDIPMTLDTAGSHNLYVTDYVELGQLILLVPCANPLTIQETFGLVLNASFFRFILMTTLILSIAHSLVDYYFNDVFNICNFLLSDKVFPGVLGQAFVMGRSPVVVLKMLYLLIGFIGIFVATQFAGSLNNVLTTPYNHKQMQTFNDVIKSPLKILIDSAEAQYLTDDLKPVQTSVVTTNNSLYVVQHRYSFNTTFGYMTSTAAWEYLCLQQYFFSHKSYCTDKNLVLRSLTHWGIRVPHNSPYKEPFNSLIHRVQEVGLIKAWHSRTFVQMLKLKMISLRDPNPRPDRTILSAYDFFWIWMIVVGGLVACSLVFLLELWLMRGRVILKCNSK